MRNSNDRLELFLDEKLVYDGTMVPFSGRCYYPAAVHRDNVPLYVQKLNGNENYHKLEDDYFY